MHRVRVTVFAAFALAALTLSPTTALAHCEIPCGIYADQTRFDLIEENLVTIDKSMKQITELSADPKANINQLVRWVENKEAHADKIRHIAVQYFLAQRVKPAADGDKKEDARYRDMLVHLHAVIQHSMKAKQTVDLSHVEAIREHTAAFRTAYMDHHKK